MIELLPAFFVASAVVGSAAAASVGALSKAACLRLFRSNGQRLSVRLLLGTAVAETVIMSISLALAFTMVAPYATPQQESKTMFFAVLVSMSAACHIAFAWVPNFYLLSRNIDCSEWFQQYFGRFGLGRIVSFYDTLCGCLNSIGVVVELFPMRSSMRCER